jgi:antitoxin component YwqK of YwqJK toxin-antitoxin module
MFYVYGIFDPLENNFFYIGKGKGKRFEDHFKKNKWDFNSEKLNRIRSLEDKGYPSQIKIIVDNIDENTAFEIEKELVCRIGRKCFSEGPLLNLAPGGKWSKGQSPFYSDNFIKSENPELQKFSEILSTLGQKNKPNRKITQESRVFKYDKSGEFLMEMTIDEIFNGKIQSYEMELFNQLFTESFPIINRFIYSLVKYNKITVTREIPYGEFDIFDPQLHEDYLKKKETEDHFELTSEDEHGIRLWIKKEKDEVSYKSFYQNGNCKSERSNNGNKPIKKSIDYDIEGRITVEITHLDENSSYIRKTFFDNGNVHIEFSQINGERKYKRWFRNGEIEIDE